MSDTINTTVIRKIKSGDVIELRLKRPIGYNFTPGQCIDIYDNEMNCRPYSIASGIKRENLTLYVKKLPGGKLSEWIDTLRTGDVVRISKNPYGFFTPGETDKPFVFIATGTGIAPFISYIESHADLPEIYKIAPKGVFLGCRYIADAVDTSSISAFSENYKFCITRDEILGYEDICFKGRVTDFLRAEWDVDPDTVYYLCGLDTMLSEVSEILHDNGVPWENIQQELFYFSS